MMAAAVSTAMSLPSSSYTLTHPAPGNLSAASLRRSLDSSYHDTQC